MHRKSITSVSVIVPHRGNDEQLRNCILAIRDQTYPKNSRQLIIVLNEERRRSLGFTLLPGEQVLWQPKFHSYSARNTGIAEAQGKVIALTDSDTAPDPTWLEEGIRALSSGVDLVAGSIELTFRKNPLSAAGCYEKLFAFDQEKNVALGRSTTANLFVRKELFSKLGLFEETAVSGEDFRWTSMATQNGAVLKYASRARVKHPAREKLQEILRKARRVGEHFPPEENSTATVRIAFERFLASIVLTPSQTKINSCTSLELALAYLIGVLVQIVKSLYFLAKTVARSKRGNLFARDRSRQE